MADPVAGQLIKARESLLDLSLHNRMLNYRPTKRTSIRIVDEQLPQVWRLLVEKENQLEFLARSEHEKYNERTDSFSETADQPDDESETFDQPSDTAPDPASTTGEQPAKRHADRNLQTNLEGESLQTSLLRLFQESNSAREELGINVLFLAMGFLHWKPTNRDDTVAAPLFLIPVELERTSAKRRFKLTPLGDAPILNPCIARKLAVDFHLSMPPEPTEWEGFDIADYMQRLAGEVASQSGWRVGDDLFLGLFSFNKYLMYLDLGAENWPEEKALTRNALLRAMCGDRDALAAPTLSLPAARDLDRTLDPTSVFQVLDADSSQQAAIAAAKAGANLVIQGPPGTGKSQSITNIISECLAAGKSVLFVSQKMAALEVVKKRLENVGLGDFCLELHSTKANRTAMLAELQRVMTTAPPAPAGYDKEADRLRQTRQHLNDYVRALHEPEGRAAITPFDAMGKTAILSALPQVTCDMPGFHEWDRAQIARMSDLVNSLKRHLQSVGVPAAHPFYGVRLTLVTQQTRVQAAKLLEQLAGQMRTVVPLYNALVTALQLDAKVMPVHIAHLLQLAKLIIDSSANTIQLLGDTRWDTMPDKLESLLRTLGEFEWLQTELKIKYDVAQARLIEWPVMGEMHMRATMQWYTVTRWFRPSYWRDRKMIMRLSVPSYHPPIKERISDLGRLAKLSELHTTIKTSESLGKHCFGQAWRGPDSSSAELHSLTAWLMEMRKLIRKGIIGPTTLSLVGPSNDHTAIASLAQQLEEPTKQARKTWTELESLLKIDENLFLGSTNLSPEQYLARTERMITEFDTLDAWAQFQDVLQPCEKSPLSAFFVEAEKQNIEPVWLPGAFEKQFHTLWVERLFAGRDALRQFTAARHEDIVTEFAKLDSAWLQQSRHRLYARLAELRPATGFEAAKTAPLGILQSEFRRKRGGRSIRRVLKDAGEVIQRTKPCFMMSPLSVAQFLAPDGVRFDVVIFDEASQVEPADALGAIARGKQLILVGDSKQLPPTSFFSNLSGDAASENNEGEAGLADMESILDRGESVLTTLSLRWHYRSKHESLITFSNHEFYNNELVIFPSCHTGRGEMGVTLEHDASHLYDRGKSRANRAQATRVAQAVFEHYRKNPGKSLGVATFSVAQRQAVLDEVEKLRRQDDSLETFFDPNHPEHFFVKNLETIQGDERDVIFMSVGHGRSTPGERVGGSISNLNGETGWRRLNVLVTRARERYVVFTSILGQELDLSGTQARGVHSFKRYLDYAHSGRLSAIATHDGEFGSDFEKAIYNALQDQGVTLHRKVGCAGYAIDLCVVDPAMPGRYILGIECDGTTYHSSATARDRDRLRQQVLEELGWRIHRVWSTDWYRRPEAELRRVLDAIAKARSGQLPARFKGLSDKIRTNVTPAPTAPAASVEEEKAAIATEPYALFAMEHDRPPERFYTDSIEQIAALVASIVRFEGPIHASQLARRTATQYGLERIGEKMQERITNAAARRIVSGALKQRDEFYWPAEMIDPPLRCRLDDAVREIDFVCMEELGLAAERLATAQFGMSESDLVAHTARVLGFRMVTAKIKARVTIAIQRQIENGKLASDATGLIKAMR